MSKKKLWLLDDHGRVKSQIINVVYQIQRFNFDINLVVTRKSIIQISPPLRLKSLYINIYGVYLEFTHEFTWRTTILGTQSRIDCTIRLKMFKNNQQNINNW
jgi:hypothetical protein